MGNMIKAVLIGGLVAGLLDISYAFVIYGPLATAVGLPASSAISPEMVLQSVAGGWIGRTAAFAGGLNTAIIGGFTHFGIAIVMALIYALLFARLGANNPIVWGFLYGLILFFVMNYVVVPLSAAADGHFTNGADAMSRITPAIGRLLHPKYPVLLAGTVFTHTVLVGIPIALASARFNSQQA